MSMVTIIAAVAVVTGGCDSGSTTGDGGGSSGTPTQNGVLPTGPALPSTELVRVTGEVELGTVPGCMVLNADFTKYVLLGGDQASLEAFEEDDTEVTVTGKAHTPTPTTCTDGVPLAIQEIVPAV